MGCRCAIRSKIRSALSLKDKFKYSYRKNTVNLRDVAELNRKGPNAVLKIKAIKEKMFARSCVSEMNGSDRLDTEHEQYEMAFPGQLIRRLQQVAVSLFHEVTQSAGFDITPVQYAALGAIAAYPKIDQATLAGVIAYDRATIGGVVDRLESKGLVRRTLSSEDRRVRLLVIEPAGISLLKRLAPFVEAVQDRILDPLDPSEKAEFLRLAAKLADANNERSRAPLRPHPLNSRKRSGTEA